MDVILPFHVFFILIITWTTLPILKYCTKLTRAIWTWIDFKELEAKTNIKADWEAKLISIKWHCQPMNSPPQICIWSSMHHVSHTFQWYADLTTSKRSESILCGFPLECRKTDCSNGLSCSLEGLFLSFNVCIASASRNSRLLGWNFHDSDLWKLSLNERWAKDSVLRSTGLGLILFYFLFLSFWLKYGTTIRVMMSSCLGLSTTRVRSFLYKPLLVILTHVPQGRVDNILLLCSHLWSTSSMIHMP